jgi:hypothetical protein
LDSCQGLENGGSSVYDVLTFHDTEELTSVSRMLADILDEHWVKGWENAMGGKFVDIQTI